MSEYITNGNIILEPINKHHVSEGSIAIYHFDKKLYIVSLDYINKEGLWVLTGDYNGELKEYKLLYRFSMITVYGIYPIAYNFWKSIIKHNLLNTPVNGVVIPHKFKTGKYNKECSNCFAHFTASKTQPYCEKCCQKLTTIHLTEFVKNSDKLFKELEVKQIAEESYHNYPKMGKEEFDKWLSKKLK